jgi:outer membrane biosynthesis protein TonB
MNTGAVAAEQAQPQKPSHLKAVPSTNFEDETATESFMLGEGNQPTAELPQQKKPAPPPPQRAAEKKSAPAAQKAAPVGKAAKRAAPPKAPYGQEGKGAPKLFFELYWGDIRQAARSFQTIKPKKPVLAGTTDKEVPAWGFNVGQRFVIADQRGGGYRVFVPPGAAVEKRGDDGNFYPLTADQLEAVGQRRYLALANGQAIRLTNDSETWMVAYVQQPLPRPFVNPMRRWPWLNLFILGILSVGAGAFIAMAPSDELPDFQNKKLPPVAVKLLAPEKKKEREKKVEQLKKKTEEKKKVEQKKEEVKKPEPKQEVKQTVQAIAKVEKVQKQMKDMLAAIDKLGAGPGAKNKTDYKLSGLIGKEPIANAGLGTFGLGGGGAGGQGFKGMENLRGKGIGALGAGNIGKGAISGTVSHATSHNIGAQGTIDKEAVAKVINSHLHEVSACYERALLKTPGLAGKIVLEWGISLTGTVTSARTKSSTMKSAEVEACILNALKLWKFPPAKGAGVVISYPFMFNSVGF